MRNTPIFILLLMWSSLSEGQKNHKRKEHGRTDTIDALLSGSNHRQLPQLPKVVPTTLVTPTPTPMKVQVVSDDELSRNITIILENLLKDYDSGHHPGYDSGIPTIVKSNILVRSMGPFSEHQMDYSMDCYFRQSWQDRRLSFNGPIETLSLSIKMLEGIWKPDTFFYNGKKSYVHTITQPNKLLRIKKDGSILYSVRLTIKAKCPMELRDFPMDRQSCPLVLGSYGYTRSDLIYVWDESHGVKFLGDVELSQFDLISSPYRNATISRKREMYSTLQVSFNLRRKQGYFLIQIYIPCILIVVLSWVSFWLNREATSDRISLGITTVLTLSTLALDSRTDLPKVHYATALDWFIFTTFGYCMASLIQFAAVHYFTKIGSGEDYQHPPREIEVLHRKLLERLHTRRDRNDVLLSADLSTNERWENRTCTDAGAVAVAASSIIGRAVDANDNAAPTEQTGLMEASRPSANSATDLKLTVEMSETETVASFVSVGINHRHQNRKESCWKQMYYCLVSNQSFRQKRNKQALAKGNTINSVSRIDRLSRILFPLTFFLLNAFYWWGYVTKDDLFTWEALDKFKFY